MRKFLMSLLIAAVMSLGFGFAQNFSAQYDTSQYAGGALGLPFTGYYGMSDVIGQDLDLRIRASVWPIGFLYASVGADVLAPLTAFGDADMFSVYGGGGVSAGFITLEGVSGIYADATGVVGLDARLAQEFSVFLEGGLGVGYGLVSDGADAAGGFLVPVRGALGLLYHF